MNARRMLSAGIAGLGAALVLAGSAAPATGVSIRTDRTEVASPLGENFNFRTTIANSAATATRPLIAHLNLLSFRDGVYVDPEDWSTARTRYIGTIPAGGSQSLTWKIQAVNVGSFAAYITVLDQDGRPQTPATGAVVRVEVAKRKGFDSKGVVPLALGMPLLIGVLAVGVRMLR